MEVKQFEDKNLSCCSFIVMSDGELELIDLEPNPHSYSVFSKQHKTKKYFRNNSEQIIYINNPVNF